MVGEQQGPTKEDEEEEEEEGAAPPPAKPVSKAVEWLLAAGLMLLLVGFLFALIYVLRTAKHAVM
jgi:hypothetical protein